MSQTKAACAQNSLSSRRFSRTGTRCGASSRPARIRPAWDTEAPVPPTSAAISAWVHTEVPSGGPTLRSPRLPAGRHVRKPRAGRSQLGRAAACEPAPPGPRRVRYGVPSCWRAAPLATLAEHSAPPGPFTSPTPAITRCTPRTPSTTDAALHWPSAQEGRLPGRRGAQSINARCSPNI
jgi:hypothetical protein